MTRLYFPAVRRDLKKSFWLLYFTATWFITKSIYHRLYGGLYQKCSSVEEEEEEVLHQEKEMKIKAYMYRSIYQDKISETEASTDWDLSSFVISFIITRESFHFNLGQSSYICYNIITIIGILIQTAYYWLSHLKYIRTSAIPIVIIRPTWLSRETTSDTHSQSSSSSIN